MWSPIPCWYKQFIGDLTTNWCQNIWTTKKNYNKKKCILTTNIMQLTWLNTVVLNLPLWACFITVLHAKFMWMFHSCSYRFCTSFIPVSERVVLLPFPPCQCGWCSHRRRRDGRDWFLSSQMRPAHTRYRSTSTDQNQALKWKVQNTDSTMSWLLYCNII